MKRKLFMCVLVSLYLQPLSGYATDYFTESFYGGFDLDGCSVTFTPEESASGYSANMTLIDQLPSQHTTAGTVLGVSNVDDSFSSITISGSKKFSFYGTDYTGFYVGSNGYITFGDGDIDFSPSLIDHFDLPRISGLFTDLTPGGSGAVVGEQFLNRVVITFYNVARFGQIGTSDNTFQIEMFFDGRVRLSWLGIDDEPFGSIIGLSAGTDQPSDFVASDFSNYAFDLDLDGLPDSWERAYFGHRDNCIPDVDWDGDGYNNLAEYIIDTDPINPSSKGFRFEQEALPEVAGESRLVFNWTALEGREYTIRCADSLIFDDFSEVLQSGIAYPVNAYTTTVDQAKSSCFFKVDVQLAD